MISDFDSSPVAAVTGQAGSSKRCLAGNLSWHLHRICNIGKHDNNIIMSTCSHFQENTKQTQKAIVDNVYHSTTISLLFQYPRLIWQAI